MNLTGELVKKGILDQKEASSLELEARTSGKAEEELILEKGLAGEEILFNLKSQVLEK